MNNLIIIIVIVVFLLLIGTKSGNSSCERFEDLRVPCPFVDGGRQPLNGRWKIKVILNGDVKSNYVNIKSDGSNFTIEYLDRNDVVVHVGMGKISDGENVIINAWEMNFSGHISKDWNSIFLNDKSVWERVKVERCKSLVGKWIVNRNSFFLSLDSEVVGEEDLERSAGVEEVDVSYSGKDENGNESFKVREKHKSGRILIKKGDDRIYFIMMDGKGGVSGEVNSLCNRISWTNGSVWVLKNTESTKLPINLEMDVTGKVLLDDKSKKTVCVVGEEGLSNELGKPSVMNDECKKGSRANLPSLVPEDFYTDFCKFHEIKGSAVNNWKIFNDLDYTFSLKIISSFSGPKDFAIIKPGETFDFSKEVKRTATNHLWGLFIDNNCCYALLCPKQGKSVKISELQNRMNDCPPVSKCPGDVELQLNKMTNDMKGERVNMWVVKNDMEIPLDLKWMDNANKRLVNVATIPPDGKFVLDSSAVTFTNRLWVLYYGNECYAYLCPRQRDFVLTSKLKHGYNYCSEPSFKNDIPGTRSLGCFMDDKKSRKLNRDYIESNEMTPAYCVRYCRNKGHKYAGVQDKTKCFCGSKNDDLGIKVPTNECIDKCSGDVQEQCGGPDRNFIYDIYDGEGPWAEPLGCFADSTKCDLFKNPNMVNTKMTPNMCQKFCRTKGYRYAGLRFGDQCVCLGEKDPFGEKLNDDECAIRCSGNKSLKCGGKCKNYIYDTVVPVARYLNLYKDHTTKADDNELDDF